MVTISNLCSLEAKANFQSHYKSKTLEHFFLDKSQENNSEAARFAMDTHDLSRCLFIRAIAGSMVSPTPVLKSLVLW